MVNSDFRIVNWGSTGLVLLFLVAVIFCVPATCSTQSTGDLIELKFELPKPFSGGTPFDGSRPNLEIVDFKERPPLMVPSGTHIVSRRKPVTSSAVPLQEKLDQAVDGDKRTESPSRIELPAGLQWVQIDLQEEVQIHAILIWHNYLGAQVYIDVIGQASNDPDFRTGVTQVYNNDFDNSAGFGTGTDKEYIESYKGRLMALKGLRGRYVRFYTQGNVYSNANHLIEIDIFGKTSSHK